MFTGREEYSTRWLDKHGRFDLASSGLGSAVREPVVSMYLRENGFQVKYPNDRPFAVCLTHDVDNIYPTLTHMLLSSAYSLKKLDFGQIGRQLSWRFGNKSRSPYINFTHIMEIEKEFGAKSTFYFLATDRDVLRFRYRIEEISGELKSIVENGWEVGLHTGYYSFDNLDAIVAEKARLEKALGREVIGCRNHYLRFKTPETWELLSKAGFKYDATYGYHDGIGFRNHICYPFRPFNLNTDSEVNIVEIPLTVMDDVLFGYNSSTALSEVQRIIRTVEKYNGVLTLLWHNHIFDCPFREKWAELYKIILEYCYKKNAWMTSAEGIYSWVTN